MTSPYDRYIIYQDNPYENDCDYDLECIRGSFETNESIIEALDLDNSDIYEMMDNLDLPHMIRHLPAYENNQMYEDLIYSYEPELLDIIRG